MTDVDHVRDALEWHERGAGALRAAEAAARRGGPDQAAAWFVEASAWFAGAASAAAMVGLVALAGPTSEPWPDPTLTPGPTVGPDTPPTAS